MLGFLHGIKAAVEGVAQHAPTLRPVVVQINDMLSRLQSPRKPWHLRRGGSPAVTIAVAGPPTAAALDSFPTSIER